MADDAEDKTEAASGRRLQQAREEGSVAVSREVSVATGLAVAALFLALTGPDEIARFFARLAHHMSEAGTAPLDASLTGAALRTALFDIAAATAPLVLAILAVGVIASALQTGFLLNFNALQPAFNRLDPRRGLARLFGREGLMQAAKSSIKVAVFGWLLWRRLLADAPTLAQALFWDPWRMLTHFLEQAGGLLKIMLGVQVVIAGADIAFTRFQHARRLRMTKQEVKDEAKETDGNPHVKNRLRQIRRARARQRMMAAVPKATVIVTNPTHYAVALAYQRGQGAPRVIAKGVDEVAFRIREVAAEHRIPIVANPPVARALHEVELDREIPSELFKAVAEIIAYVWRLRGEGARR